MLLPDCPLRWAQYFNALQPVLHALRAHLLPIPVSANLTFPQGPSAQSAQLVVHSPLMQNILLACAEEKSTPENV
jgi:hypothetical protein